MKPSSASTMTARLCAILLLSLQATIVTSTCRAGWSGNCGGTELGARTAKSTITHYVDAEFSGESYNAEVIFHWGPENTVIKPADYLVLDNDVGDVKKNTIQRTHTYDNDGVYYVGYSVIFGEGSSCEGSVIDGWYRLTFDDDTTNCEYSEEGFESDEIPTWTPTDSPIITTSLPSERPTPIPTTSSPTKNPTPEPTTSSPTKNPTKRPITSSPTKYPTPEPTTASPSKNPTKQPTTRSPSKRPTRIPTTSAPSKQPTFAPVTSRPTKRQTPKPTNESTNLPIITNNPTPEATPTTQGREQTEGPTLSATRPPTPAPETPAPRTPAPSTPAPIEPGSTTVSPTAIQYTPAPIESGLMTGSPTGIIEDTIAPVWPGSTTTPPTDIEIEGTIPMQEYTVSSSIMVLYHSGELDEGAKEIWTDVTSETIQNSVAVITDISVSSVKVTVTLERQGIITDDDSGRLRILTKSSSDDSMSNDVGIVTMKWIPLAYNDGPLLRNRKLQSTTPLQIKFITTITFPSDKSDWDGDENALVASGFITPKQQSDYLASLKEENNGSYFDSLESMTMEVDGKVVTEEPAPDGDGNGNVDNGGDANGENTGGDANGDNTGGDANGAVGKPDDQGGDDGNNVGEDNNSMPAIIGGVVGGVCVLILVMAIGMYYTRRNRRNRKDMETFSADPSTTETQQQQQQQQEQQVEMIPDSNKPYGGDSQTPSTYVDDSQDPGTLCFGTIESREGDMDDVSTIGDPWLGDAVNAVMDTDNTVGESMVSSQQDLFVYGLRRPHLGTDGTSRAGGSTINTSTIGSKGMVFGDDTTLEDIYNTPDGGGQSPSFQRMTVVAGPGKLGIVLDNPTGDLPLVHAIKESSPLNGKVQVGDLLLSVDGVDCRGMMAHKLSKFLTSRSQNPTRTLVLARGSRAIQASHIS